MNFALNIPIEQFYTAYRKAKREAFTDTNCAHGLKFAAYESDLFNNLARLRKELNSKLPSWQTKLNFLGGVTCIPKSAGAREQPNDTSIHCQSSDPEEQWKRDNTSENRATAEFRPVIDATVEFMVVSALWILEVGHLYDEKLDTRYAVGNRLRRWRVPADAPAGTAGKLNTLSPDIFQPYFSAYGRWRTAGLRAMRQDIKDGHRIVAIPMDLKRFYHQVNAKFLLHEAYLQEIGIDLNDEQRAFTAQMIEAFATWNKVAGDKFGCEPRGLPVGLTASSLIANVLLREFDRHVVAQLAPSYYARYVDDVFLVVRHAVPFNKGEELLKWLERRLAPMVIAHFPKEGQSDSDGSALEVKLEYGDGSHLLFVGKKQKIFQLEGAHGLDLIGPIEEQIRKQSSEYRDLPELPDTESQMAHRALLVTSNATLDADALRKADAVALKRSGFALLLGDVEAHVRDLGPKTWERLRYEFYGLAHRHLLSPAAFFDYSRYYPRIVGIMVTCGDWKHAENFILGFKSLLRTLRNTCRTKEKGTSFGKQLTEACDTLANRICEAVFQSVLRANRQARELVMLIKKALSPSNGQFPTSVKAISTASNSLLYSDWSRRTYSSHWLASANDENPPPEPVGASLKKQMPFAAIQLFRHAAELPIPHWPALAFPTRPIPLREITTRAPSLLKDGEDFSTVVRGLRGAWMPEHTGLSLRDDDQHHVFVPNATPWVPKVAITSFEVTDAEWAAAANGTPHLTLERYRKLNAILDAVVACRQRPDYVILPECALPRHWAMPMIGKLLPRGVSVIAGLEYREDPTNTNVLHNETIVALRTNFPGYRTGIYFLQPKSKPAWGEREHLADMFGKAIAVPSPRSLRHPVYVHQGFCFGVLICSEMTDIANRMRFQGQVDALFIPEWNQDVESFNALVESAALDVHAYIVQANNRRFGDSRMRAPMKIRYQRDLIRVTGGLNDYFVVGEIDYMALRGFQSHAVPPTGEDVKYKPFPVGFPERLSRMRRTTPH